MADLHDYHLRLAHAWGTEEAQYFHNPGTSNYKATPGTVIPKFTPSKNFTTEPMIPPPTLFKSLSTPPSAVTDLPSVGQCATHLELLEAIYTLRREVVSTTRLDDALGLPNASRAIWRKELMRLKWEHVKYDILNPEYPGKAEAKWPLFLSVAVLRFEIWAEKSSELMRQTKTAELPHLPPLDVLTVWHALMLNPGDYIQFCKLHGLDRLILAPFPWRRIHQAIRSESASIRFDISPVEAAWFKEVTQQPVSLFTALEGPDRDQEVPLLRRSPVSEAVFAWADANSSGPGGIKDAMLRMDKTDKDYPFVRLLAEAKKGVGRVQPLVQNVIRQGSFVDKMHAHLWLRSPAVECTLMRAVDRYDKFTQLFRDYPRYTLVPTLDMDLVWHTHQLSHAMYRRGITAITGRFIGHDDKIGKDTLDVQENHTKRLFEDVFDEECTRCMCWDCEAIFSAAEADDDMSGEGDGWLEELTSRVREDLQYHRATEMARRRGWPETQERVVPLPTRKKESS